MKRRKKQCRNCDRYFIPDKFNSQHQHYCSNPECRHASSNASKKKYRKKLSKSEEYLKAETERVKSCQRKRPHYHRNRKKSSKKSSETRVLRDIAIWQDTVIKGLVSTLVFSAIGFTIGERKFQAWGLRYSLGSKT